MTKQTFIALADMIREHNENAPGAIEHVNQFDRTQIEALASFCAAQNPAFNRSRWLSYIAGECGSNGGKVKK